jgi:hypothetical protein
LRHSPEPSIASPAEHGHPRRRRRRERSLPTSPAWHIECYSFSPEWVKIFRPPAREGAGAPAPELSAMDGAPAQPKSSSRPPLKGRATRQLYEPRPGCAGPCHPSSYRPRRAETRPTRSPQRDGAPTPSVPTLSALQTGSHGTRSIPHPLAAQRMGQPSHPSNIFRPPARGRAGAPELSAREEALAMGAASARIRMPIQAPDLFYGDCISWLRFWWRISWRRRVWRP